MESKNAVPKFWAYIFLIHLRFDERVVMSDISIKYFFNNSTDCVFPQPGVQRKMKWALRFLINGLMRLMTFFAPGYRQNH